MDLLSGNLDIVEIGKIFLKMGVSDFKSDCVQFLSFICQNAYKFSVFGVIIKLNINIHVKCI